MALKPPAEVPLMRVWFVVALLFVVVVEVDLRVNVRLRASLPTS